MKSDVDIDVGTGGHRVDDLRAGGLRGGLCEDAGWGYDRICVGN